MIPTEDDVLAVLSPTEPRTVMEVADRVCGRDSWRHRTNVRNRLYALEMRGLAVCDDTSTQRWSRAATAMHTVPTFKAHGDHGDCVWELDQFADALLGAIVFARDVCEDDDRIEGWEVTTFAEEGPGHAEGLVVRTPRGTFLVAIEKAER